MGKDPTRESPFYFLKPNDALVTDGGAVPYPPRTTSLHHEVELVVAIGRAGRNIPAVRALEHVFGYAVGNDVTRRDLQLSARDKGRPWDTGKAVDHSAPMSAITPASICGHPDRGRIQLSVNGTTRQDSDIGSLIWNVPEIIADLSTYYHLLAGDLIFTGTPKGVGPMQPGDSITASIDGLATLRHTVVSGVATT
jgi:fumarylpyruvate hydrolase